MNTPITRAFSRSLSGLAKFGFTSISVDMVPGFVRFCHASGVHSCGGAFVVAVDGSMTQYLYL